LTAQAAVEENWLTCTAHGLTVCANTGVCTIASTGESP